ncbi:MAG: cell division protein ZapA [Flavobacteriia bacterium]
MGKLSLKVVVAGRTYPLTVNQGEEAKVTKAAEDINRSIKMLQDKMAKEPMVVPVVPPFPVMNK